MGGAGSRFLGAGRRIVVRGGDRWCGVTISRCGATNSPCGAARDGVGPRILRARRRSPVRGAECSASQLRSAVRGHARRPSQRGSAVRGVDHPCEVARSARRTSEGACEVPIVRASSRCCRVRGSEPVLSIMKVTRDGLRTRLGALRLRSRPAVARIHRISLPTNRGGGLHGVRGRRHERPPRVIDPAAPNSRRYRRAPSSSCRDSRARREASTHRVIARTCGRMASEDAARDGALSASTPPHPAAT